jgi:ABC-type Fe3+ transport system permease subunit
VQSPEHHRHAESANHQESEFTQARSPEDRKNGVPWQFRVISIAIGAWAIAAGLNAYYSGQNWFASHSPRFGWQVRPTLDIAVMGFMFVLLGILPWGWFARRAERKQQRLVDRLMSTSSRHQPPESDR